MLFSLIINCSKFMLKAYYTIAKVINILIQRNI